MDFISQSSKEFSEKFSILLAFIDVISQEIFITLNVNFWIFFLIFIITPHSIL